MTSTPLDVPSTTHEVAATLALAADPQPGTEPTMHDCNHLDCCTCCRDCYPPDQPRDEATLRKTYGPPIWEQAANDTTGGTE